MRIALPVQNRIKADLSNIPNLKIVENEVPGEIRQKYVAKKPRVSKSIPYN